MHEGSAYVSPENERVQTIARAANRRKISIRRAVAEIVGPPQEARGLFLVGTRQTSKLHTPNYAFMRYSRNIPGWHYVERPGPEERPMLIVTKLAKVAIASALFGDINQNSSASPFSKDANQPPRSQIDRAITNRPRPHFGWTPTTLEEDGIRLHALPELINAAAGLTGSIDIVQPAISDARLSGLEPLPDFGVGMYVLRFSTVTIATINVLGKDLPEIVPVTYPDPIV